MHDFTDFRRPYSTKFEHNMSIRVAVNAFRTEFWKCSRKGSFFDKTLKILNFSTSCDFRPPYNSTMIIDRQKFITKWFLCVSFPFFTVGINSKSFPWFAHSVQETSPNFLRRRLPVDGTSDCQNGRGLMTSSRHANLDSSTDNRALGAEYCIVGIPLNLVHLFTYSFISGSEAHPIRTNRESDKQIDNTNVHLIEFLNRKPVLTLLWQ